MCKHRIKRVWLRICLRVCFSLLLVKIEKWQNCFFFLFCVQVQWIFFLFVRYFFFLFCFLLSLFFLLRRSSDFLNLKLFFFQFSSKHLFFTKSILKNMNGRNKNRAICIKKTTTEKYFYSLPSIYDLVKLRLTTTTTAWVFLFR